MKKPPRLTLSSGSSRDAAGESLDVVATLRQLTDEELVARYVDGTKFAFQEIVHRYQDRLLNLIYRIIGDRDKAEDLAQETFVRVYRHIGRFDDSRKFSTWIYTIAGNLAKNELRNRTRNPVVLYQMLRTKRKADLAQLEFGDETYAPDDLFAERRLREQVQVAVTRVPENHRVVFVLRELEGKSYEEIAEITGITLGTVKSRLNRARSRFAGIIAPMLD